MTRISLPIPSLLHCVCALVVLATLIAISARAVNGGTASEILIGFSLPLGGAFAARWIAGQELKFVADNDGCEILSDRSPCKY